jgi:hypothetical protein
MSYRSTLAILERFALRLLGWIRVPSLGTMTKARRKLRVDDCRTFLHKVVDRCAEMMRKVKTSYGDRRFVAIDGTRIIVRRSRDTARRLHRPHDTHYPQGLMLFAVDVFRRLPLDWVFAGKKVGERTAMNDLLVHLKPGDVAVMDRGFPSRKLFGLLLDRGIDVIARMNASKLTGWKEVQEFLKTGKKNAKIDLVIGRGKTRRTVQARLVERDRQRGRPRKGTKKERMVILTTLSVEDGFDRAAIIKLYGARWGVETLLRELKSFIEVEPGHSDLVQGIEQEIAASLIWMALATLLQTQAEDGLPDGRRVVRTDCLRLASEILMDYFMGRSIDNAVEVFTEALRKHATSYREQRHAPRKCKMPYGRSRNAFA